MAKLLVTINTHINRNITMKKQLNKQNNKTPLKALTIIVSMFCLLLITSFPYLRTTLFSDKQIKTVTEGASGLNEIYSHIGMNDSKSSYTDIAIKTGEEMTIQTKTETMATINTLEKEASSLVMESPHRVTVADGFFYQPITEDVKERIYGLSYKENCTVPYEDLNYVGVLYVDFDGNTQTGEIICNKAIAKDLAEIFMELYENEYEIDKIRLVDEYNADDDLSCLDNNTSCFNFRVVGGTNSLSKHALGLAIDINPFYNPYVTYPNGVERISPPGSEPYADRNADFPHKIDYNDLCYKLFMEHGFTWGGDWKTLKDYQHFQKTID